MALARRVLGTLTGLASFRCRFVAIYFFGQLHSLVLTSNSLEVVGRVGGVDNMPSCPIGALKLQSSCHSFMCLQYLLS